MIGQTLTKVEVEKDSVGIGDLNNVTITITTSRPSAIKSYSLKAFKDIKPTKSFYANDSLDLLSSADFEFLDLNVDQPVILNATNFKQDETGAFVHKNISRFIAWDVGYFEFPDLEVTIDTSRGVAESVMPVRSAGFSVAVPKVAVIPDSTQIIVPILPIIEEEKNWRDWHWLIYIQIYLLAVGLFMWYLLRKRKKARMIEEEVIIVRPSHEVAFERLDDLEAKQLWQQGKVKEYQSELTYTIREYLENRFDIQALESTTGEINRSLKTVDFDPKHTTELNNILQIADMVKFAKAEPEESIHQEFMEKARSFVKDTLFIKTEETDELAD